MWPWKSWVQVPSAALCFSPIFSTRRPKRTTPNDYNILTHLSQRGLKTPVYKKQASFRRTIHPNWKVFASERRLYFVAGYFQYPLRELSHLFSRRILVGNLCKSAFAFFGLTALSIATQSAHAQTAHAIANGGDTLISFNVSTPGTVTTVGTFGAGLFLDAIDFRPATGQLFGYSDLADTLYTVNTSTGAVDRSGGERRTDQHVPIRHGLQPDD